MQDGSYRRIEDNIKGGKYIYLKSYLRGYQKRRKRRDRKRGNDGARTGLTRK